MPDQYLGEIKTVAFDFIPRDWAACNGQLLSINQNRQLFSLLGTTFGGDGSNTFGLPDLRGRAPIHIGLDYVVGGKGGETAHALASNEAPAHTHNLMVSPDAPAPQVDPTDAYLAPVASGFGKGSGTRTSLHPATVSKAGGQPHNNIMPSLPLTFVIALKGIYPSKP